MDEGAHRAERFVVATARGRVSGVRISSIRDDGTEDWAFTTEYRLHGQFIDELDAMRLVVAAGYDLPADDRRRLARADERGATG